MRLTVRILLRFLLLACLPTVLPAQEALNNDSIVKLVKSGLSEEAVLNMVSLQPGKYSLSVDDVLALKSAGVPDKVIAAMVAKLHAHSGPKTAPSDPLAKAPSSIEPGMAELEAGVYLRQKDKQLAEVTPEIVTWRTGGFAKTLVTGGLTKGHVNGVVKNASSRLQLSMPAEFVIRCPEGTSAAEYQLLLMDRKNDRREFRALTGGIIHASGGADKNAVTFQFDKLGPRTFSVKLTELKKGEYGFLPPGAVTAASAASVGKIFTFGVE